MLHAIYSIDSMFYLLDIYIKLSTLCIIQIQLLSYIFLVEYWVFFVNFFAEFYFVAVHWLILWYIKNIKINYTF